MNEFENKLILKEEDFQTGLFPKVPEHKKKGSAYILTNGCKDDIIVSDKTTGKQLREGKYTKLIEISTAPYMKEIRFNSPGKEIAYSFDVYVKAVIQVEDPISFYENRNLDVDAYFNNLFLLDVKKITRKYSILEFDGMDDELTQRLSAFNTIDETTGFSYRISVVDAMPGAEAQEYVQQISKQELDAKVRGRAHTLAGNLTDKYEEAIRAQVVEGKITEVEAIEKIQEHKEMAEDKTIRRAEHLLAQDLMTGKEAKECVKNVLNESGKTKGIPLASNQVTIESNRMNEFYDEGEDE